MNKSLFIPMTRGLEVRNTTTMDTVTMLATGLWLGSGTHSCGAASGMPLMEAEASIWNKITYIYIYQKGRKGGRGGRGMVLPRFLAQNCNIQEDSKSPFQADFLGPQFECVFQKDWVESRNTHVSKS